MDISSFTGSNVNSWMILIGWILQLRSWGPQHKLNQPFIVTHGGLPVEVTLLEVFQVYLFEVVFARAHYGLNEFFATGGYLGVKGNIQLTSLAFSLVLDYIKSQIPSSSLFLAKVAGDDTTTATTFNSERDRDEFLELLKAQVTNYVGALKAFTVLKFEDFHDGNHMTDLVFCKKRVGFTKKTSLDGSQDIHVYTEYGLPVMSELFSATIQEEDYEDVYQEFTSGVTNICAHLSKPDYYLNFMKALFNRVHHEVPPSIRSSFLPWWQKELVREEGILVTVPAKTVIDKVLAIRDSKGFAYRGSFRERSDYLLSRKKVALKTVIVGLDEKKIIMLFSEIPPVSLTPFSFSSYEFLLFPELDAVEKVVCEIRALLL